MATTTALTRSLLRVDQDVRLDAIYKVGDERLRVTIRRNAYDFQSHATIEAWSRQLTAWQHVASLPREEMQCMIAGYWKAIDSAAQKAFEADEARLLAIALEVIA